MYRNLGQVQGFFGPVHTNSNHWTSVYINLVANTLLYIDPLSPPNEQAVAETYTYNWLEWGLLHNNNVPNCSVPTSLTAITTPHLHQKDNRNCGIFTMCVRINIYKFRVFAKKCPHFSSQMEIYFQFAKRLLQGVPINGDVTPSYEGATIAAEILDASDSLWDLCAKCGQRLTTDATHLMTCCGICLPRRIFHSKCIPENQ